MALPPAKRFHARPRPRALPAEGLLLSDTGGRRGQPSSPAFLSPRYPQALVWTRLSETEPAYYWLLESFLEEIAELPSAPTAAVLCESPGAGESGPQGHAETVPQAARLPGEGAHASQGSPRRQLPQP